MATVKGQNLRLYFGNKVIGRALECSLHIAMNVQERSTKDDEGGWARNHVVNLQWDASAQAVVIDEQEATAIGYADVLDLAGQTVHVRLNTTGGDQNREADTIMLAGDAIISDIQMTAQNRQRSTYQIQLTGKKNALIDIRALVSSDQHLLVSSDGHILCAPHES